MNESTETPARTSRWRSLPRGPLVAGTGVLAFVLTLFVVSLVRNMPIATLERDEIGVQTHRWSGSRTLVTGKIFMWPLLHELRRFPLTDAEHAVLSHEHGAARLLSSEGMPITADVRVKWAIDARRLAETASDLPDDIAGELVVPLVTEVVQRAFAERTVLDIIASQRLGLRDALETRLAAALEARGLLLRNLTIAEIRLPDALADRVHRPDRIARADGSAPLQTSEGLSIGAEIDVRFALDPTQLAETMRRPGGAVNEQLLASLVQGVVYRQFAQYTVREIFAGKREQLKEAIEADLQPLMQDDGLLLRSVTLGNIDLPADFRAGMDRLLAAELATQQMEHTLALKEKQVRETELQAEADKVRRDKAAEAAANEQVIAAKAQEEAMKHVLPFKQKQLEQRRLEADADKATRISMAEAAADARRIEAAAEADSRRKLADADAYRIDQLGKLASVQLERDGALISRYPLLIQKTMADKLSDKISVIIAPPPADGGFVGNTLLGANSASQRGQQP